MKFAGQIAESSHVSLPSVYRAARKIGVKKSMGVYYFTEAQAKAITKLLQPSKQKSFVEGESR